MSDVADQAQVEEDIERDIAIRAALKPPAGCETGPDWIDGSPCCRFCGDSIPERRLLAVPGTGLCVACAAEIQEGTLHARTQGTVARPSAIPPAFLRAVEVGSAYERISETGI